MIQLDFLAVLAQWPALLKGAAFTLGAAWGHAGWRPSSRCMWS